MTSELGRSWKPQAGRSKARGEAEQNKAAGGSYRRAVNVETVGAGTRGSVVLQGSEDKGTVRAYLRWRFDGRTASRSLGVVRNSTRMANLVDGWALARLRGLVRDEILPQESWASSADVRASMRGNRGRDTGPERRLRSLLHARGLRYRVSVRPIPTLRRTADIVFIRAQLAVFVDGCYWHGCPEHYRPASLNPTFWRRKIGENKRRDAETNRILMEEGWTVFRCWEHEDPADVANRIVTILQNCAKHCDAG